MKLAAIVYHNTVKLSITNYTPRYQMLKLFDDGSSSPVADERIAEAIRTVEGHGYEAEGRWINEQPAIAWSPRAEDFEAAWSEPVLRCPCRFSRSNDQYTARRVGDAGYIVPTRRRAEVWQLRQDYPSHVYCGDLLMVPTEILYQHKVQAERRQRLERQAHSPAIQQQIADRAALNVGRTYQKIHRRRRFGGR